MDQSPNLRNWAGNYQFSAKRLHRPKTVEEIRELVIRCKKLKVVGTGHSFNGIADCNEDQVSLEHMNRVLSLDEKQSTVTVEAGIKYGDLCLYLHSRGYGLHNLASLPHTTIAGAVATATHGSGDEVGNLATAVLGLEFVSGRAQLVQLSKEKNGEDFEGSVVALGGLGVVTQLTLEIEPTYDIRQHVYTNLRLDTVEENFERIFSSAYSVSLFTDWRSSTVNQMWLKRKSTGAAAAKEFQPEATLFGATLATGDLHPIEGISPINCTTQMGIPGPWYDRLPHFRMNFTPSSGEELQAEYLIPREHAVAAVRCIDRLKEHIVPVLQICEMRTIGADNLWMSPCYHQPCLGMHFTLTQDWPQVSKVLPMIDHALEPFRARPHWGKLFTMSPAKIQSFYPKLPEFRRLLRSFDPEGKFRNRFLDTYIHPATPISKL